MIPRKFDLNTNHSRYLYIGYNSLQEQRWEQMSSLQCFKCASFVPGQKPLVALVEPRSRLPGLLYCHLSVDQLISHRHIQWKIDQHKA